MVTLGRPYKRLRQEQSQHDQFEQERSCKDGCGTRGHNRIGKSGRSRIWCITWQGWPRLRQDGRRQDGCSTHRRSGSGCGMSGRGKSSHGRGDWGRSSCDRTAVVGFVGQRRGTTQVSHGQRGLAEGTAGIFIHKTRTTSNDRRPS